jgi:hypothetical protein
MFQLLYLVFLVFLGFLLILRLCHLIIGKSVCEILGHDWERLSIDTDYNKKKNTMETVMKYKCRTCGCSKIERYVDVVK